jgi:adenine-specific DNA-methyltransferase
VSLIAETYAAFQSVDHLRRIANAALPSTKRSALGQFMTPPPVAQFMASMLEADSDEVTILDAGAGSGMLFASAVLELASRERRPKRIDVNAFEVDSTLLPYLIQTKDVCAGICDTLGIQFTASISPENFIEHCEEVLFLRNPDRVFDCAILNPPYKKIQSASATRKILSRLGVETTNYYSAFVALAIRLLRPDGELVAITPRSFCNGPYFSAFRKFFLRDMNIRRVHVYEARNVAFREEEVLQENVIFSASKGLQKEVVEITSSFGPDTSSLRRSFVEFARIVNPLDKELIIHLPTAEDELLFVWVQGLPSSLTDLGLEVSTGKVVDFRAIDVIRDQPKTGYVPLIYPTHCTPIGVIWPSSNARKPNAISGAAGSELLVPNGNYVLVKRFTAKEERRRVVACVYEGAGFNVESVGFENHLNYFHENGSGLDLDLSKGLAAFLNCSSLDRYFRLFSGHTQVNASDLRRMRYPRRNELRTIGAQISGAITTELADALIERMYPLVSSGLPLQ